MRRKVIYPKCPYCHKEMFRKDLNSPLTGLFGEYCSDTVKVKCEWCGEIYYVSEQTRFISRKNK